METVKIGFHVRGITSNRHQNVADKMLALIHCSHFRKGPGYEFLEISREPEMRINHVGPVGATYHLRIEPIDPSTISIEAFADGFAISQFVRNFADRGRHRRSPMKSALAVQDFYRETSVGPVKVAWSQDRLV